MLPADENVEAKRSASIRTVIGGVLKLMRHFPYTELLVVFFPFYAYLITVGYVTSPLALFLMAPFVLTNAVGFIYNNIVDLNDPSTKNPIVAGTSLSARRRLSSSSFLRLQSSRFCCSTLHGLHGLSFLYTTSLG